MTEFAAVLSCQAPLAVCFVGLTAVCASVEVLMDLQGPAGWLSATIGRCDFASFLLFDCLPGTEPAPLQGRQQLGYTPPGFAMLVSQVWVLAAQVLPPDPMLFSSANPVMVGHFECHI